MASQTDLKTLLEIKKHLDHGFYGSQIAEKLGVCESVVSRLVNGAYGRFPTSDEDPQLKKELGLLNLKKMRVKLSKRKVLKSKKAPYSSFR